MQPEQQATQATTVSRALSQFRQVTIKPAHSDGVWPFTWGTLGFVITWAVAYWGASAAGFDAKWQWVFLCGAGIGVIGLAYCLWRRAQRKRLAAAGIAPATP